MISSKGRYALRVMMVLADRADQCFVPLREIAEDEDISLKYLECIMRTLVGAGMVEGVCGKGGGYRLCRAPEAYRVGDILRLMEGSLSPVACVEDGPHACDKSCRCRAYPVWKGLADRIEEYLDGITLADLIQKDHTAPENAEQ